MNASHMNLEYYFASPLTKDAALRHFLALDKESLYTRFCRPMSQSQLVAYIQSAQGSFYGVQVFGVTTPVSVVHYVADPQHFASTQDHRVAEVGFSTLSAYRGRGYGRLLMFFIKGLAEVDGVDTVMMSGLATNKSIQKLAKESGFVVTVDYDEFEAQVKTFRSACRTLGKSFVQFISSPVLGQPGTDSQTS